MYTWPNTLYLYTDWNDVISTDTISNSPEVGLPIRRARSLNVKHTLTFNFRVSLAEFNSIFVPFMRNIKSGLDAFYFPNITSATTGNVTAYISDASKPYTIKRQDESGYIISMTIMYIVVGGAV